MCGIAGFYNTDQVSPLIIDGMLDTLVHRGPDHRGKYTQGRFTGGMNRLSINGLLDGQQPLSNYNEDIIVFYNGEIYNSPELRKQLLAKGHVLKSGSDGDVIPHLYQEVGEDVFQYLDGMYGICIWDKKQQILLLGRDMAGEKPLYYFQHNSGFAFASEIKALQKYPAFSNELNYQAIWDFPTFLWIPEPDTIFNNVYALPKGHYLKFHQGKKKIYKIDNNFKVAIDRSNLIEQTQELVTESIKSRLLSDVPLGCFLSGGLDSSIITTVAKANTSELSTFTISFEDLSDPYHGRSNESQEAEYYAEQLQTKHHTIKVSGEDFKQNLKDFCFFADQPFAVSSGLGVMSIAKYARDQGFKVLLTGDGADELFGGYSWYHYLQNMTSTTSDMQKTAHNNLSFQNFGIPLTERLESLSRYTPQLKAWAWHYYASENEKANLFNRQLFAETDSSIRHFYDFKEDLEWQPLDFIRSDRALYLGNEMLCKADRMTMAYSVEGRVPFVAPKILTFVEQLKFEEMVSADNLKIILRAAFKGIVPQAVLERPKHGFNVPIDHWLKDEWYDLLQATFSSDSYLSKLGIINRNSFTVAVDMVNDPQRLNGHTLFCFIMLEMWLGEFYA